LVILCGPDELCHSTALSPSVVPTSIPLLRDSVRKAQPKAASLSPLSTIVD
jgi:hypothetical protein